MLDADLSPLGNSSAAPDRTRKRAAMLAALGFCTIGGFLLLTMFKTGLGAGGPRPHARGHRGHRRIRRRLGPDGTRRAVQGRPDRHHDRLRGALLQPDDRRGPLRTADPRHSARHQERPGTDHGRHRRSDRMRRARRRRRLHLPHHHLRAAPRLSAAGDEPVGARRGGRSGRGRDEHDPVGRADGPRRRGPEDRHFRHHHATAARPRRRYRLGAARRVSHRTP